jgi:hypothetical protein
MSDDLSRLKPSVFRLWDTQTKPDVKQTMKLFGIHPRIAEIALFKWLIEWYGGYDAVVEIIKPIIDEVYRAQAGTYDFEFYISDFYFEVTEYEAPEIYFDVVFDVNGDVYIGAELTNGEPYDKIWKALDDENISYEVQTEIKDTILDKIYDILDVPFYFVIDEMNGKRNFP